MQIVVNDTNLFIDLIHAELIDFFFQLPFEVHTTDFVVDELIRCELISPTEASVKLQFLLDTGSRLSKDDSKDRFEQWRK